MPIPRIFLTGAVSLLAASVSAEVNKVETVAPDVYFHEGDITGKGHCNNGWVIFEDYVLVIDANFPSGADEVIPKIKKLTNKPIRFAFDTHHHGDHAYGNQVWVDNGATPVAHAGVIDELNKYEPKRWNDTAKDRKDVAASKLKYPTLLFPRELFFDDGKHRVELHHFGVAHTHGDGFAWLPKERILFTGDACVNGAYNFVGDGNIQKWIETLEAAKKLNPKIVCPGHGPTGDASVLDNQQEFFRELLANAKTLANERDPKSAVEKIQAGMKKNTRIARYIGGGFPAQLEKAHIELGGKAFLSQSSRADEEKKHLLAHGHSHTHGDDRTHPHSHSPKPVLNSR